MGIPIAQWFLTDILFFASIPIFVEGWLVFVHTFHDLAVEDIVAGEFSSYGTLDAAKTNKMFAFDLQNGGFLCIWIGY